MTMSVVYQNNLLQYLQIGAVSLSAGTFAGISVICLIINWSQAKYLFKDWHKNNDSRIFATLRENYWKDFKDDNVITCTQFDIIRDIQPEDLFKTLSGEPQYCISNISHLEAKDDN